MSVRFTAAALLIASAAATRCGELKVTTCTDDQCSVGCVETMVEPAGCSNSYLTNVEPMGTVGSTCDWEKSTFRFFSGDDCTGGQYR